MSADKMPPLREDGDFWRAVLRWEDAFERWEGEDESFRAAEAAAVDAEVHAYARAYAAEQTRELVEVLNYMLDDVGRASSLPSAVRARALIAKHKEQP
jgi:antitoxin component HigA of HigAB toxin-antitoxin module